MPTPRARLSTVVVDEKIYAIGGAAAGGLIRPSVEVYDPTTDTWTEEIPLPVGRAYFSASIVNGEIYAIGGISIWSPVALDTVEVFDTGFRDLAFAPQGKLATTWGQMRHSK
jgi:N-acetylneuraminic acid mutarotase